MAGSAQTSINGKAPGVAKEVKHTPAGRQWPDPLSIGPLIEKEAGFLALDDVCPKADTVFKKRDRGGRGLAYQGLSLVALLTTSPGLASLVDAAQ
jgi:hypothetical protein